MQLSTTARFLVAFLAGLLFGSGVAMLVLWPEPGIGPLAVALVGVAVALLAAVTGMRRRALAAARDTARSGTTARPWLGGVDDVAAVVAALETLRRGSIAQGGGS